MCRQEVTKPDIVVCSSPVNLLRDVRDQLISAEAGTLESNANDLWILNTKTWLHAAMNLFAVKLRPDLAGIKLTCLGN